MPAVCGNVSARRIACISRYTRRRNPAIGRQRLQSRRRLAVSEGLSVIRTRPASTNRPPMHRRACRCCRCATWWCTRTWSSRCSSGARNRSTRSTSAMRPTSDHAGRAEAGRRRRSQGRRPVPHRHRRHDPAAAQAARRHRQGAGRRRRPRAHRTLHAGEYYTADVDAAPGRGRPTTSARWTCSRARSSRSSSST